MKKTYILDTNVLIADPDALFSFQDNDVIIPMIVIEELDKLKTRPDTGFSARKVSRSLDELRTKGKLIEGVDLPNGGTIKIKTISDGVMKMMPLELQNSAVYDNVIIAMALHLTKESVRLCQRAPILVSKDSNVRIKCDAIGVETQDYLNAMAISDQSQIYKGVDVYDDHRFSEMIANSYTETTGIEIIDGMFERKVYPNQILVVKDGSSSVILRAHDSGDKLVLRRLVDHKEVMGLHPKNKEQNFAFNLLMDPNISLTTLVGSAGTGKTIIALAAGLEQLSGLGSKGVYDRVIVTRPIQSMGKDLGYLPGTLMEKMDPWVTPIKDNLNFIFGYKKTNKAKKNFDKGGDNMKGEMQDVEPYLALLMRNGKIEVEAIPYIRGRSIPGAFLIIDEAQNLTPHELKTIITRSGEGTKVVLTGDIEQIDNVHVDARTNGLSHAVEKFKNQKIAGHVTLIKGERSALATISSQIL